MNPFEALLKSRRFWFAVLALIQTALFIFKPDFPLPLWDAISNVLLVLIVSITVENIGQYIAGGISAEVERTITVNLDDGTSKLPWLLKSRKFWLAVLAVVQSAVFSLFPNIPEELWQSINTLLMVLIGLLAVEDATDVISLAVRTRSKE